MSEFREKSLDDTGTRYTHLQDLKEDWEEGIELMSRWSYLNDNDKKKIMKLKFGVELIESTISGFAHYADHTYKLRKQINEAVEK